MRKDQILIPVSNDYENRRKVSLLENIKYWCEARALSPNIIKNDELKNIQSLESYAFCYLPLTLNNSIDFLSTIDSLPVVVDTDTPVKKNPKDSNSSNSFVGRRVAVRNAFGLDVSLWEPQQQVPMIPQPYPYAIDKCIRKDVIVFDVKRFHWGCTHLYIASLIANVCYELPKIEKELGHQINIYFTSFMDCNLYFSLFETINSNSNIIHRQSDMDIVEFVKKRLIPPVPDHSDYLRLMQRCRLFITEHGDLCDADVVFALCLGLPTLTYSRDSFAMSNGFQATLLRALQVIDPEILDIIHSVNRFRVTEEMGVIHALRIGSVPAIKASLYEKYYLRTWDCLYEWATEGIVDKDLNDAVKGRWNRGVTVNKTAIKSLISNIKAFNILAP